MVGVLLDTHILYRWRVEPRRLSKPQSRTLALYEGRGLAVGVSAITLWELAMLAADQRLKVHHPFEAWLEDLAGGPQIDILPITVGIAVDAASIRFGTHNDPADQIIVATARCHALKLLTADQRIRDWGRVPVI